MSPGLTSGHVRSSRLFTAAPRSYGRRISGEPRIEFPGAIHHVFVRALDGFVICRDEFDYVAVVRRVAHTVERNGWLLDAYCVMPTHFHLLVETPLPNLGNGMQSLNTSIAQRFNVRYDRYGHVFQGPYGSELVEDELHHLELVRYVVLNPKRAHLEDDPAAWPYSSYRATAGIDHAPPWLRVSRIHGMFASTTADAQRRYREFVASAAPTTSQPPRRRSGRAFATGTGPEGTRLQV